MTLWMELTYTERQQQVSYSKCCIWDKNRTMCTWKKEAANLVYMHSKIDCETKDLCILRI